MGILPPEMIYKIASYIKSEKDIMALAEVFQPFGSSFLHPVQLTTNVTKH